MKTQTVQRHAKHEATPRALPSLVLKEISSHLIQRGYTQKAAKSMERCGENTGILLFGQCGCTTEVREIKNSCGSRLCGRCSKKRKSRIYNAYVPFFNQYKPTGRTFYNFLTISPPNVKNLAEGTRELRKSFSKFIRREWCKKRIFAGFYVIEQKQKPDLSWNVHLHAVVFGTYLENTLDGLCYDCDGKKLSWNKIKKAPQCRRKSCRSMNVMRNEETQIIREWSDSTGEKALIYAEKVRSRYGAVSYLTKYLSLNKDDFQNTEGIVEFIISNRHTRLISAFGQFYGKGKDLKKHKKRFCCPKCSQDFIYYIDWEATLILKESLDAPPPPPTLSLYVVPN